MMRKALVEAEALSVYAFRCTAAPCERPFTEMHERHSLPYVRRGSFGCRTEGGAYDFVAGALMVGRPGREYVATHEHHGCGDECLSIKLSPAFAEEFSRDAWSLARTPPLPELMVLGELLQTAAEGSTSIGIEEAALLLLERFARVVSREDRVSSAASPRDRRRVIEAALWLQDKAAEAVGLEDAARYAGLSPCHFLRLFSRVVGATPHQYLVRLRLARGAKLLAEQSLPVTDVAVDCGFADLSNFVRTFARAAGMSPTGFRRAARTPSRAERKIFQERLASAL